MFYHSKDMDRSLWLNFRATLYVCIDNTAMCCSNVNCNYLVTTAAEICS